MLADEEFSKPPGLTEMKVVPQREDREVHPALLARKEEKEKGGVCRGGGRARRRQRRRKRKRNWQLT